ncbi:hypothetical protein RchiOBHm_Chr3g0492361 [Rosa chinensis]|uniref:Uncharacterized protein n=1 Tax=Rosa chinensis TaxID=74649 RepID=A0A2P6RGI2_ROSCH|nr:hypothetical protein RchiOBHm_Chr3g0492361 [Rosa chinensis]
MCKKSIRMNLQVILITRCWKDLDVVNKLLFVRDRRIVLPFFGSLF